MVNLVFDVSKFKIDDLEKQLSWMNRAIRIKFDSKHVTAIVEEQESQEDI